MLQKGNLIGSGRTAQVFAYGDKCVVKLFRDGFDEYAKHEFKICTKVCQLKIPAPEIYEMVFLENRSGIVYERIDGISMLRVMKKKFYKTKSFGSEMGKLHFQIGQYHAQGLPTIHEKLTLSINRTNELKQEEKERILQYLNTLPGGDSLCHLDFHPDNILITEDGMKLIDWTNACVGNHCADVARTRIILQSNSLPPDTSFVEAIITNIMRKKLYTAYMSTYIQLSGIDESQITAWLLPVAAARLIEGIEIEKNYLLEIIRKQLRAL